MKHPLGVSIDATLEDGFSRAVLVSIRGDLEVAVGATKRLGVVLRERGVDADAALVEHAGGRLMNLLLRVERRLREDT